MPYVHKPAFEQTKTQYLRRLRALAYKEFAEFERQAVELLESTGLILVQKVRKTGKPDSMVDFSCQWVGLSPAPHEMEQTLKRLWPPQYLLKGQEFFTTVPVDEAMSLIYAAEPEEGRFLTGRILVQP